MKVTKSCRDNKMLKFSQGTGNFSIFIKTFVFGNIVQMIYFFCIIYGFTSLLTVYGSLNKYVYALNITKI